MHGVGCSEAPDFTPDFTPLGPRAAARGWPWCPSETPFPETKLVDGKREGFNTIPPSDSGFFDLLKDMIAVRARR